MKILLAVVMTLTVVSSVYAGDCDSAKPNAEGKCVDPKCPIPRLDKDNKPINCADKPLAETQGTKDPCKFTSTAPLVVPEAKGQVVKDPKAEAPHGLIK
jgi:hypothetical protein